MPRKTHTSTAVKARWNKKTYANYTICLRYDRQAELIEFVTQKQLDGKRTSEIFSEALELLREKENNE